MRVLLHFIFTGFATIELEEWIGDAASGKTPGPKTIWFRKINFTNPSKTLNDTSDLQHCADINFIFCNLQTIREEKMQTPPLLGTGETVKLCNSVTQITSSLRAFEKSGLS